MDFSVRNRVHVEITEEDARWPRLFADRRRLLAVFANNEKDNLSKAERNILATMVGELVKHFGR